MGLFGFKNKKVKTLAETVTNTQEGLVEIKHTYKSYWITKDQYTEYLIKLNEYNRDKIVAENTKTKLTSEIDAIKFKVKNKYNYRDINVWVHSKYIGQLNTSEHSHINNCPIINHGISIDYSDKSNVLIYNEITSLYHKTDCIYRPIYESFIIICFVYYVNGDLVDPRYIHYKYEDIKDDPEFILVK